MEKKAQKKGFGGGDGQGERKTMHTAVADSRFAKQQSDPRFQRVPVKKRKVIVDKRFSAMLDDEGSFARKAITDKYGRKVKHEIKEDMGRFYEMEEEEGSENEEENKEDVPSSNKKDKSSKKASNNDKQSKKDGEKVKPSKEAKMVPGMDKVSMKLRDQDLRSAMSMWNSESSSDDESEEEREQAEEDRMLAEALDPSQPLVPVEGHIAAGEETSRLALVNMDWERVKAMDLLLLLRSFAPSNGQVLSLKIYRSEFGKQRMEHERHFGPGAYISGEKENKDDDDDGEDENEEVDMIKLRKYEAEKLKYFYAVAECDTPRTAMVIYDQCDGVEYEASSNVMDLRYIPEEETFDDKPHTEASGEAPPDYVSPFFTNRALGHTKVELTWDRDDPERDVLKGKGLSGKGKKKKREAEMEAIDYTPFVASTDSEEEDDDAEAAKREKFRSLLLADGKSKDVFGTKKSKTKGADDDDEEMGDMQITFTPGLTGMGTAMVKRKAEREKEENMSTWEKYQKKKEDRKAEAKKKHKKDEEDEDDLPADSERVDDSFFADDPFFKLPDDDDDEADGDADGSGGGIFKKKKAKKQAAVEEEKRKKDDDKKEKVNVCVCVCMCVCVFTWCVCVLVDPVNLSERA
jgi:hypothetical protein